MWPLILVAVGVVAWRVSRGSRGAPVIESGGDDGQRSALRLLTKDDSVDELPVFAITWAYVPFDSNPSMGKVRPVVLLGSDEESITIMELRSERGPTTETMTWVPIGTESAQSFDHKRRPGWVKVSRPRLLPAANLSNGQRPLGQLTSNDARGVWAAMLEYVI